MTYALEEPPGGWYQPEQGDLSRRADVSPDRDKDTLALRAGIAPIMGLPVGKGHAGFRRVPAVVLASPPPRRRTKDLPGGRRPVVAVLDTFPDRLHPWLARTDGEAFVADVWTLPEGPPARELGLVDAVSGHGTFIAGLIQQLAPDSEVLILRIMHADGTVIDSHLIQALAELLERVQAGRFVDVVCLALGFRMGRDRRDIKFFDQLRHVLGELGNLGVRVVASAGNDPESQDRVYPAALATAGNKPKTGLISVGSYDPDGKTPSVYSSDHDWITNREIGTLVVSTMPAFSGPKRAGRDITRDDVLDPVPYDPDDFTCGFAQWSGTSFAAANAAGRLAQALVTPDIVDPALDRHERAHAALAALTPVSPG